MTDSPNSKRPDNLPEDSVGFNDREIEIFLLGNVLLDIRNRRIAEAYHNERLTLLEALDESLFYNPYLPTPPGDYRLSG